MSHDTALFLICGYPLDMKHNAIVPVSLIVLACMLISREAPAQQGTRPRNLVVRPDGTVLATSMGSDYVTQLTWKGTAFDDPVYVHVGGESWGVCLDDDDTAIVSLPFAGKLVRLVWNGITGRWEAGGAFDVSHYCTEVIDNPLIPSRVFVANRGPAPDVPNAEEWQHAVYDFNVETGATERIFVTDREPRALALSPDGLRLFVGHVQGALGGKAVDATNGQTLPDHPLSNPIYDGGSVIVFNADGNNNNPTHRFGIGSPVRGLAVLPVVGGRYRVFFTHVGYGAASEAPKFGGRDIANLITSIAFDSESNEPVGIDPANALHRQDFALGHAPDSEERLAILHEKLAVRSKNGRNELWITNSGSGTITRVRLTPEGLIDPGGQFSITFPRILPTVPRAEGGWLLDANMTVGRAEFETVQIDTVLGDSVTHFNTGDITSNPRGIFYDHGGTRDRIVAVTNLSHALVRIDPGPPAIGNETRLQPAGAANPVIEDEKNFFTSGRGFDFRETGLGPGGAAKANNMTCATCHVEGHIDGKIRFTVRVVENMPSFMPSGSFNILGDTGKPVHVASAFDMGATEWMFFEGLKTIRDGIDPREPHTTGPPDERCGYCQLATAGFFFDTDGFTRDLESPMSPYAPNGVLTPAQNEGRLLFEAMNCSRCHAGATRQVFPRTQEAAENLPPGDPEFTGNGQFGPTPVGLQMENRILHDPAQIVFKNDLRVCPRGTISSELMNMTDVGTRNNRDGFANGINTPGLAGAWDNRPYMHDGRYRTLTEVLKNTYLNVKDGHRAAPLVFEGTPDNANGGVLPGDPCEMTMGTALFPFDTHRQYTAASPAADSLKSVFDYLVAIGKLSEVLDFLGAASSQTDLCGGEGNIPAILEAPATVDSVSTFAWTTTVPAECLVRWGLSSQNPLPNQLVTPLGTSHTVDIVASGNAEYKIEISAFTRGVCFEQPVVGRTWLIDTTPVTTNDLAQNFPNPFNPTTSIRYSIQVDSHVHLAIFDVKGSLVRTLVNETRRSNEYVVDWDGHDDKGSPVATGIYFYRLQTPAFLKTRKMVLLK